MSVGVFVAILVPIAEVWAAVQVAHHIGWLATILLILLLSASGPALVRRQGTGVWRRARRRMQDGEVPGREAIDGVLLLVAGGLLTFPGFLTGALGLLLLLPPVRSLVRTAASAWLARKVRKSGITLGRSVSGPGPFAGRVTTTESHPIDHPRGALGPATEPE